MHEGKGITKRKDHFTEVLSHTADAGHSQCVYRKENENKWLRYSNKWHNKLYVRNMILKNMKRISNKEQSTMSVPNSSFIHDNHAAVIFTLHHVVRAFVHHREVSTKDTFLFC